MKIIILCANYEPGGAQRAAIRLCSEFQKNKIDCTCWYLHRKSADFTASDPILMLNYKIKSPIDIFIITKNLFNSFKREKADAVISFLPYANILGLLIAFFCGIKKRISSHRNLSEKELSLPMKAIDFIWARMGIYTAITAVSKSTKNSFLYYGKSVYDKMIVVNNGIYFVPSDLSKQESRKRLGINFSAFVLGNVGRLVEQKNHQLLISILPDLKDKIKNIVLVIIGKGDLKKSLETSAMALGVMDNILFIDELNIEQIPIFLNAIDVFVMPSHFEGMSNALAEALYAGLPIISSDVESQRDVLIREQDSHESGILVSNSSHEKWKEAILSIYKNETLRNTLSQKALVRSKDFTVEKMADGFISAINT